MNEWMNKWMKETVNVWDVKLRTQRNPGHL